MGFGISKSNTKNAFLGDLKDWGEGVSDFQGGLSQMSAFLGQSYGYGSGTDNVWGGGGIKDTGFSQIAEGAGTALEAAGPWGQVASGALTGVGNIIDMAAYNPDVDSIDSSYRNDSAPSFDLGDERIATQDFVSNYTKDANRKVLSSTASGAATGAAFGPWGALIGGAVGGGLGLAGKLLGKGKAEDAQGQMATELSRATGRFNEANKSFYERQNAMQKYQARRSADRSLYNIPNNSPYFT